MSYQQRPVNLSRQSVAVAATAKVKPDLHSYNKAIDLWSLAVCSFCLTVLCHSIANMPEAPSASNNVAPQASSSSTNTNSNFALKLFTLTSSRPEVKSEK